jgi:S1-C subfamily serine protease
MLAKLNRLTIVIAFAAIFCLQARVQVSAQEAAPRTSPGSQTADNPQMALPLRTDAPQVNAVVHRLSGIKMLDLLRRKGAKVAQLNNEALIGDDVHTNITAGLGLQDGMIVARLPQAELELGTTLVPIYTPIGASAPSPPSSMMIVQSGGKQLPAILIGFDGGTGLSLLRISGIQFTPSRDANEETFLVGQRLRILSPARAAQVEGLAPDQFFLNVGEIEGRISGIIRSSAGPVSRVIVGADKISSDMVGGIALNDAGETVGMVESSGTNEAYLIPIAAIHRAVNRIRLRLDRKPQPWLGARGSSLAGTSIEQLMTVGWRRTEANRLLNQRVGVVLTSVPPQTPAALGKLRVGDVVTRVNSGEVKGAEDFSSLLKQAGGRSPVRFTVVRPESRTPRVFTVRLRESLYPVLEMEAAESRAARLVSRDPFVVRGLEALWISPQVAERFNVKSGLVVTFVHPESDASLAGLIAGDVIETIDGRELSETDVPTVLPSRALLGIVRNREKLKIELATSNIQQR